MSLATRLQTTALNLLTRYGESVSCARFSGTFDPDTGVVGSTSTTTYSGFGYPSSYTRADVDGELIRQDDILLIFRSTTVPQVNDTFTLDSKTFTALNIQVITVAGSDIIYKVQLRQ